MNDNEQGRRTPEEYLEFVHREEQSQRSGKLKIFLGMAAGVGKTYAMLEAAQKLKVEGVDLVVGVVDTHGRQETAKLLTGLEIIPQKEMEYHQTVFYEMDLDAILKRKPQLVLVDELAHQNVPGSRHPKRWQDLVEILDHGISVYTTLNVQHIESLNDVVERIAGITIRETVPDLIIDRADSIELIDITPTELRQRLKEGKVYLGTQSAVAADHFFQEDRLTALREIVLRYSAEKVDQELRGMFSTSHWTDSWKPRERLLVAVSHSPHSQKLIRITRRLAFNMDAPWVAVHVDDGKILSHEDQETLNKNLALARDLGAEVIATTDSNIVQALKRIARQKSVTQIIIGRSPPHWLDFFQTNSLLNKLARECTDIDLHVIRQGVSQKKKRRTFKLFQIKETYKSYLIAACSVFFLTIINWIFLDTIGYRIAGFSFLLAILALSLFFRFGPILFASVLYALIWIFIFIPTSGRHIGWNEDLAMVACYFFTAVFTGILTSRAKKNKEILMQRERSVEALYEIVHEFTNAYSFDQALDLVKRRLSSVLGTQSDILFKQNNETVNTENSLLVKNEKEKAAANWVIQNGKEAGWSTSALPFSENLYIPIKVGKEAFGVLVLRALKEKNFLFEDKNFLYRIAQQLGIFYEKHLKTLQDRLIEEHKKIEKTYQSTLELIANLFEGPLLTIQDAVKKLKTYEEPNDASGIINPIEQIRSSVESLLRISENISAMVNLKAGFTPLRLAKYQIKDLIDICSETLKKSTPLYRWEIEIDKELPEITADYDLIELLFYNLALHAVEFSPPETKITIKGRKEKKGILITILGEGQSIPPEMVESVFEKFYRMPEGTNSGLGLGLAIAKVIADIHQGQLIVETNPSGGITFSLFLPTN